MTFYTLSRRSGSLDDGFLVKPVGVSGSCISLLLGAGENKNGDRVCDYIR